MEGDGIERQLNYISAEKISKLHALLSEVKGNVYIYIPSLHLSSSILHNKAYEIHEWE